MGPGFGFELFLDCNFGQLSLECSSDLQNAPTCLTVQSLEQVSPPLNTKHDFSLEQNDLLLLKGELARISQFCFKFKLIATTKFFNLNLPKRDVCFTHTTERLVI